MYILADVDFPTVRQNIFVHVWYISCYKSIMFCAGLDISAQSKPCLTPLNIIAVNHTSKAVLYLIYNTGHYAVRGGKYADHDFPELAVVPCVWKFLFPSGDRMIDVHTE